MYGETPRSPGCRAGSGSGPGSGSAGWSRWSRTRSPACLLPAARFPRCRGTLEFASSARTPRHSCCRLPAVAYSGVLERIGDTGAVARQGSRTTAEGYRRGKRGETARAGVEAGGASAAATAAFQLASHPLPSSPCPLALVSYRKSPSRGEKRKGDGGACRNKYALKSESHAGTTRLSSERWVNSSALTSRGSSKDQHI